MGEEGRKERRRRERRWGRRRREPLENFARFQNEAATCLQGSRREHGDIYIYTARAVAFFLTAF